LAAVASLANDHTYYSEATLKASYWPVLLLKFIVALSNAQPADWMTGYWLSQRPHYYSYYCGVAPVSIGSVT